MRKRYKFRFAELDAILNVTLKIILEIVSFVMAANAGLPRVRKK